MGAGVGSKLYPTGLDVGAAVGVALGLAVVGLAVGVVPVVYTTKSSNIPISKGTRSRILSKALSQKKSLSSVRSKMMRICVLLVVGQLALALATEDGTLPDADRVSYQTAYPQEGRCELTRLILLEHCYTTTHVTPALRRAYGRAPEIHLIHCFATDPALGAFQIVSRPSWMCSPNSLRRNTSMSV